MPRMHAIASAAVLLLSVLAPSTGAAQDRMPVPDRAAFVAECTPALAQAAGGGDGGALFARAACSCSHRWLADRETMTREEFDAAATLCRAEYERDGAGFLQKYGASAD